MRTPLNIKFWDEEEEEKKIDKLGKEEIEEGEKQAGKFSWWALVILLGIFLLAFSPRLYFLFFVSGTQNAGPNWYGDVYHHWQIAYLSKTVGFAHGFLRLWDLKGMEYFWGLLHPLVLVFLFTITRSVDLLVPRLLSVFCGAGIATLLFIIIRRYFGILTALLTAIWAAFFPVLVYTDSLGMQDQLAFLVLLAGIYFWPKKPALTGIFLGLAAMGRTEYWLFGLGLILAIFIIERDFNKNVVAFGSWFIIIFLYMKYLLDKTGNPIYPVWWNYLAHVVGEWQVVKQLTADALLGKRVFQVVFGIGLLGAIFTFWKKPKAYLLFLLGFGSLIFNGFFFGFSAYIYAWVNRYYVDRLLNLPYIFLGFLLSVIFVYFLGQRVKFWSKLKLGVVAVLAFLVGSQFLFWKPIMFYFRMAQEGWPQEVNLAARVAKYYQEGKILIPEDRAYFTYALVRFHNIRGESIIGQMFDPYYYMKEDPYQNWSENREKILSWLRQEDIRLIAFYPDRERYAHLIKKESQYFEFKENTGILMIYQVKGL